MRTGLIALALTAVLAPAAHAAGERQRASLQFSEQRTGAPTNVTADVDFVNPDDPAGKPYSLASMTIAYAPGTVIDPTALPQCDATDLELQLLGAAACPAESILARGVLQTDTGSPGGFPRYVVNDVTQFNGGDELIGLAESRGTPRTRVISRGRISGATVTYTYPPLPGGPPPEPFLAIDEFRVGGTSPTGYLLTPPTCPRSGAWTNTMSFTYRDGVRQTAESLNPCSGPRGSRARAEARRASRRR